MIYRYRGKFLIRNHDHSLAQYGSMCYRVLGERGQDIWIELCTGDENDGRRLHVPKWLLKMSKVLYD